jgi:hypothetical protein
MLAAAGATFTDTAPKTVTVAEPERLVSALDFAVTVTLDAGTEPGAVYSPLALIVPTVAFPPATPFTLQATPRFCESFCTAAVNCCAVEMFNEADVGETDTLMGAVTVIVADAVLDVSAADVAVSVTAAGLGTLAGAL